MEYKDGMVMVQLNIDRIKVGLSQYFEGFEDILTQEIERQLNVKTFMLEVREMIQSVIKEEVKRETERYIRRAIEDQEQLYAMAKNVANNKIKEVIDQWR